MKTYKIELAVDHAENDEFAGWLNNHGHDATVGRSTGNYIDGERTSNDEVANDILNDLWNAYCNRDLSKAASALGRKGGASTSEAKIKAARGNGKKGGRPRRPR